MKSKWKNEWQELQQAYPDILDCGISCGIGWYWLLDHLCNSIKNYNDYHKKDKDFEPVRASQIKEKFGTLRFYVDNADSAVQGLIHMVEDMSATTCETCGSHDRTKLTDTGWRRVLCYKCTERLKLENKFGV